MISMRLSSSILSFVGSSSLLLIAACGNDVRVPIESFDGAMFDAASLDMGVLPTDMARADLTTVDLGRDLGGPAVCGNFAVEGAEACDDGNMNDNDGCDSDCTVEGTCGRTLDLAAIGTADPGGTITFSTDTLSGSDTQQGDCGGDGSNDMVFAYTPTTDGILMVDTEGSSFDTVIYVRTTCDSVASEILCDDDGGTSSGASAASVMVTHGVPLFIVVDGYSGDSGNFDLHVRVRHISALDEPCDPAGLTDRCAVGLLCEPVGETTDHTCQAIDHGCGLGVRVTTLPIVDGVGTATASTDLGSEVLSGSCMSTTVGTSAPENVYSFTMPVAGNFSVDLDVDFDSITYVHTDTCTSDELVCTDSSLLDGGEVGDLDAGTVVFVVVDGYATGRFGAYTMTVNISPASGVGGACGTDPTSAHCEAGLVCDETTSVCRTTVCNDMLIEGAENCEDGNTTPGDGCSAACQLEDQGVGGDTCAAPAPLVLATTSGMSKAAYATGDTTGASADYSNMCATDVAAADVVYVITTTETSDIIAQVAPDMGFNASVSIRGASPTSCGEAATELDCGDSTLFDDFAYSFGAPAGTYFIFVDGSGLDEDNHGHYALTVTTDPPS